MSPRSASLVRQVAARLYRLIEPDLADLHRRLAAVETKQAAIPSSIGVRLSDAEQRIARLGDRMTSNEQRQEAARVRLGEVLGLMRAEFASIHDQLDAAIADKSSAIDVRVGTDADRLEQLVGVAESILAGDNAEGPAVEVPVVEVPAPGEPAVLPEGGVSSGSSSDDVIAEGAPA